MSRFECDEPEQNRLVDNQGVPHSSITSYCQIWDQAWNITELPSACISKSNIGLNQRRYT